MSMVLCSSSPHALNTESHLKIGQVVRKGTENLPGDIVGRETAKCSPTCLAASVSMIDDGWDASPEDSGLKICLALMASTVKGGHAHFCVLAIPQAWWSADHLFAILHVNFVLTEVEWLLCVAGTVESRAM